jgi:hypothetical protein
MSGNLVMLEYIIEKNGGTVTWNDATKTYTATVGSRTQTFGPSDYVMSDGTSGRALVSVNFLMSLTGLNLPPWSVTHEPYDAFNSPNDAAMAYVLTNNPGTHWDNRERGAFICRATTTSGTYFYYEDTVPGHHDHVVVNFTVGLFTGGGPATINIRGVSTWVIGFKDSFVHTHPNCPDHGGVDFSNEDKSILAIASINAVYLGTTAGELKIYDSLWTTREVSNKMPVSTHKFPTCDWYPNGP